MIGSPLDYRFGGPANAAPVPLRARNRVLVAEGESGSIAVFPPPVTFFFTREVETNHGYVWYRKDGDGDFAMGVRQGDGDAVLAFTNGDTFKPVPGYWEPAGERRDFGYQYVGMTESRVHVLYTSSWEGGSGVFKRLMLLAVTSDVGIERNGQTVMQGDRKRLLVHKLGEIDLGDRWAGDLRVAGNSLTIGRDRGWFSVSGGTGGGSPYDERVLTIDVRHSGGLVFGAPEYICLGTAAVQRCRLSPSGPPA